MALYWLGGGEFDRGFWLAYWIVVAVHVDFFVMWLWGERK